MSHLATTLPKPTEMLQRWHGGSRDECDECKRRVAKTQTQTPRTEP